MSESTDVVLLRSADDPDPYVQAFSDVGLRAECIPVLAFRFPSQAELEQHLENRRRYDGLIATSPRVGTALDRVLSQRDDLRERWSMAPVYVVGPKTADRLRDVGMQPQGMDAGTAEALADRIVRSEPSAPLLFLSGNRRRETLPNRLSAEGISFEELVVYRTETRTDLGLPPVADRAWLVFFSPSGIEAVEQAPSVDPDQFRVAAIGPTTAEAAEAHGIVVEAVADDPSPDGLVSAIRQVHLGD